jgi:hypothetical protein
MHLHSVPAPHLPSNTPASITKSVDLGLKGGKIAADYGKKGVKFVAKGVKNNRKAIGMGIKGFKVVNGIVKSTTGISLGAEFLPDFDLLPDGIFDGGDIGDVGGGDLGDVNVEDTGVGDIGEGVETDEVDASGFSASGIDTAGFDASVDGVDVDSASVEAVSVDTVEVDTVEVDTVEVDTVEVDTVGFDTVEVDIVEVDTVEVDTVEVDTEQIDTVQIDSIGVETIDVSTVEVDTVYIDTVEVDTVEVDTVEVDTIEVDTIGVDTIEENAVEVDTVDVETIQMATVQVDTIEVDNTGAYDMDEYIVSSDSIVQESYGYEQVDVGYVEEVDVSVWYIPGTDDDDEQRQRPVQQTTHQNGPLHRNPLVRHPQAVIPHSKPITQPHSATEPPVIPTQMDMPTLTIRPHRKPMPIATIHEVTPPQIPVAEPKSDPPNKIDNLEANPSINTEDPNTIANAEATEISPETHEMPVDVPYENSSFRGTHANPNPSQIDKNEDDTPCFDISSFSGDPFWAQGSSFLVGNIGLNTDMMEKEVVVQAPEIEKNFVPQPAIQEVTTVHIPASTNEVLVSSAQKYLPGPQAGVLSQDNVKVPAAGLMGTNNGGPLGTY